jgi:hypothetical protein
MDEREHMDPDEVLKKAWTAVEASGVPESLYEAAFQAAVTLFTPPRNDTRKGGEREPQVEEPVPRQESGTERVNDEDFFDTFSRETSIARPDLEEVFFLDGSGDPGLNPSARKLGRTAAAQIRAVAILLAGAHVFGLDRASASVEVIRQECVRLNCYDSKNFKRYMREVAGWNATGPDDKRVLKPKADAQQELAKTMDAVRGVPSA